MLINLSIRIISYGSSLLDGAQTIVGIGLENILAVSTKNSLLIANKNNLQNMRDITKTLEKHKKKFNYEDNTVYRPWGYFDVVYRGHNYLIKKIFINPHSSISLQKHNYRSEHWTVIKGNILVTVDDKKYNKIRTINFRSM